MYGVALGECDHWLELLVVFPLAQSALQHQGAIGVFVPHDVHVDVGRVTYLDVDL